MLLDQLQGGRRIEIAHHQQHHILRPVEPPQEGPAVFIALRHVLHVGLEAHRGVLVGVPIEGRVAKFLLQHERRFGLVLAILAVDRPGLGLEGGLLVVQILEAVGLQLDHLGQVFPGEREMKGREVFRR